MDRQSPARNVSPLSTHPSPLTPLHSPLTPLHSPLTPLHSPLITVAQATRFVIPDSVVVQFVLWGLPDTWTFASGQEEDWDEEESVQLPFGLKAVYRTPHGEDLLARMESVPRLYGGDEDTAHPKLPAAFKVTWRGKLLVPYDADCTFTLGRSSLSDLKLTVNGRSRTKRPVTFFCFSYRPSLRRTSWPSWPRPGSPAGPRARDEQRIRSPAHRL